MRKYFGYGFLKLTLEVEKNKDGTPIVIGHKDNQIVNGEIDYEYKNVPIMIVDNRGDENYPQTIDIRLYGEEINRGIDGETEEG